MPVKDYRETLLNDLKNSEEAAGYLNAALEDEDPRVFLLALKDVADSLGGVRSLSVKTGLNRESLYRTLSRRGNPGLTTLTTMLKSLGLFLAVKETSPKRTAGRRKTKAKARA